MAPPLNRMRILCPAKLNLSLAILGLRADGYHELRMLNTAIDLFDEVTLELAAKNDGIALRCDDPSVPTGPENLAWRAAEIFLRALPERRTGVKIKLKKRIPVAGGLGGGSSDAAGVLFGLNRLTGAGLKDEKLRELGLALGADVPFFLFRSPALAGGKGEVLAEAPELPPWYYLVIRFPFGVSTAEAFQNWDLTKNRKRDISRHDAEGTPWFHNDLQGVVEARHPQVQAAREALLSEGAAGAMMSGSGPTVFGVFAEERTARGAADQLSGLRLGEAVFARALTGPVIKGE